MEIFNYKKYIKHPCAKIFYLIKNMINYIREKIYSKNVVNIKDIPIIINNFNQYDFLLILLDGLSKRGYKNIHIIDNASTYPPLLDYYRDCPYTVYKMNKNYGYLALWESGLYKLFEDSYFVYTDPDLKIIDECPDDFLQYFYNLLQKYPLYSKVGFSLRLKDIPMYFEKREDVIKWESQFWTKQKESNVYRAAIDTTFALYRPFTKSGASSYERHLRVGEPYTMQHLPWYVDKNNLSDNMRYYINSSNKQTHWTAKMQTKNTVIGNQTVTQ